MREIALTHGYVALVDDEDFEWVSQWKWYVVVTPHTAYAIRTSGGGYRKRKMIRMHRVILGTAAGLDTDHRNGDGLDNRRANLRECSHQENCCNRRSSLGSSSRFPGVSWYKPYQKWQAGIRVDGRKRHLGYFRVEAEAASAYKAAAVIAHGEFAVGARGDRARCVADEEKYLLRGRSQFHTQEVQRQCPSRRS